MAKKLGLRAEILITLSLLLGAALLFGGLVMLRFMESNLLRERVNQSAIVVDLLAKNIVATGSLDSSYIDSLIPRALNCSSWWFYGQDLRLTSSRAIAGEDIPYPLALRHQLRIRKMMQSQIIFPSMLEVFSTHESKAHFIVPILQEKRFVGAFELICSLSDVRLTLLNSQKLILVYAFLYGGVLIVAGFFLLQRNVIKPARDLLLATEAVARGDLEQRLPTAGPLEIARLAETYNSMVGALRHSRAETNQHIESLLGTNRKLEQVRGELIQRERLASAGQLAAGLAHELGNPLAALIGYLELLKQRITDSEHLDIITRSIIEAERIDFLVRELLNFSKPSDQTQSENLDPVEELRYCVRLLTNQGSLAAVTVESLLPETMPDVLINRNKLRQVYINLLLNAVQACAGANDCKISLAARDAMDKVRVSITDTGSGMFESDLGRIFDPFYTTKDPGEGTGLGLPVCQRIINEAGGMIKVESEIGVGSTFTLILIKS